MCAKIINCILCDSPVTFLNRHKSYNGYICKDCLSFIPASVTANLKSATTDYLKKVCDNNKLKAHDFDTTASYEGIYIDSIHGLFCYSSKGTKETPAEFKDIYRVEELTEVGIYCSDVRNIGKTQNIVVCDIHFKICTEDIRTDFTISHRKKCTYKVKGDKIEWVEPAELSMFRNLFNQMIDNVAVGLLHKLKKISEFQSLLEKVNVSEDWAKGVLFIGKDEEYTPNLVKTRRNELVKIFHPDRNSPFSDTKIASQINEAYRILNE